MPSATRHLFVSKAKSWMHLQHRYSQVWSSKGVRIDGRWGVLGTKSYSKSYGTQKISLKIPKWLKTPENPKKTRKAPKNQNYHRNKFLLPLTGGGGVQKVARVRGGPPFWSSWGGSVIGGYSTKITMLCRSYINNEKVKETPGHVNHGKWQSLLSVRKSEFSVEFLWNAWIEVFQCFNISIWLSFAFE